MKKLIDEDDVIWDNLQQKNLRSAIAFAALTTPSGAKEQDLYENVVEIPHYDSKWLQLLDREDEKLLVSDQFEEFQRLYRPIIKENFSD